MKLKSYFAATVETALEMARAEMGEDALLIDVKPTAGEARFLGAVEVVFGLDSQTRQGTAPAPAKNSAAGSAPPMDSASFLSSNLASTLASTLASPMASSMPSGRGGVGSAPAGLPVDKGNQGYESDRFLRDRLCSDVSFLRREVERMAQSLRSVALASTERLVRQPELYSALTHAEMDSQLACEIANGARLEEMLLVDATLGRPGASRAIVVLLGPPGAGKTTALIKLAARYGLAARRPAHIISTDVYRIAAADQLRVLASILGIGCTVVETARALAQALEEHRNKEFVFIDTPGLAQGEMEETADLIAFLAGHPEMDRHLVLPASMKAADLARGIDRYAVFAPGKLLFSRMDETTQYGALLSESIRRALPVSFLSTGQQIPEHLEAATREILTALVPGAAGPGQAGPDEARPAPDEPVFAPLPSHPLDCGVHPALKRKAAGAGA